VDRVTVELLAVALGGLTDQGDAVGLVGEDVVLKGGNTPSASQAARA